MALVENMEHALDEVLDDAPEGTRTGLVLAAVAVTLLFASLGQTIVSTALPTIVADLGGLDHITWVITAYLLASTVSAPVCGKMGDMFGRKIVIQTAIGIFLAGAVIAGLAQNMAMMVLGRAVQGLGGGGLIVVSMAVVADVLPARERGRAQGLLGGVFGVSTVIGPLIGGFLVQHLSWHWIFFVNVPVAVVALAVLGVALEHPTERRAHRIDYAGAALLAAVLSVAVLLSSLAKSLGWTSGAMLALLAGLVVALVAFVMVERRAEAPILPLPLFRINTFLVVNGVGFIVGFAMFGTITFMPLFLQVVKGVSPTASGMFLMPMMAGLLGGSIGAGQIMARTGRYKIMPVASTAVLALGLLLLSRLTPQMPLWQIAGCMALIGLGIGPVMSVGVAAIQNAVPPAMMGVGTASANMFRLIGGSIGTSIFGAMFASGLAARLAGVLPGDAGEGLSAISPAVVATLSPQAQALVKTGFTDALHPIFLMAAVCGLVSVGLSLLLREVPLSTTLPDRT